MNADLTAHPCWSTSSLPFEPESLPRELSALGEHLDQCRVLSGRLFPLRCWADTALRFVSSRLVTTAVVITALVAAGLSLA